MIEGELSQNFFNLEDPQVWNLLTDRDKGNDRSVLTNEKFSDQD